MGRVPARRGWRAGSESEIPLPGRARVRQPAPLLAYRVPSGRGATEQPNATGDEGVELSAR
ncbi:MAG TPA: hypothetical protein VME70_13005, partial [Mycobacteriales bacterium]|nr:hypothetical protein [Mycobacteriales bacterium]